jgi:hypothetical protein
MLYTIKKPIKKHAKTWNYLKNNNKTMPYI